MSRAPPAGRAGMLSDSQLALSSSQQAPGGPTPMRISNPNFTKSSSRNGKTEQRPAQPASAKIGVYKSSHSKGGGQLALFIAKGWKLTAESAAALKEIEYQNVYTGEWHKLSAKWNPVSYHKDMSIYGLGPAHSCDYPELRAAVSKLVALEPTSQVAKTPAKTVTQRVVRQASQPVADDGGVVMIDGVAYRRVAAVTPVTQRQRQASVVTDDGDIIIG